MKKYLLIVPALLWLAACGEAPREAEATNAAARQPIPVTTVAVATQQWPSIYEVTGTVRARSTTSIASKLMGYVQQVKVQVGDRVTEGQPLIVLDARDLDAAVSLATAARDEVRNAIPEADSGVAAAKSNLDLAQVTFKRMNELYQKKSISDQEFDETSAKLKSAQAAYDMAQAKRKELDSKMAQVEQEVRAAQINHGYGQIAAPVAGVVTAKTVDPGNLAVPGAPLLTIETGGYRLEAGVEESKISLVRAGQAVTVTLDSVNGAIGARVSEIVPAADAASRSYIVRIDLPAQSALHSGIFGRAQFPLATKAVTAVPAAAVIQRGQLQSVFVADNGVARTRLITLGDRFKDQVEALSGLSPGDTVIVPVPQGLADGSPIDAGQGTAVRQ